MEVWLHKMLIKGVHLALYPPENDTTVMIDDQRI